MTFAIFLCANWDLGRGRGGHHEGLLRDVFGLRFKKNWQVRWDEIRNHVVALASFFFAFVSPKNHYIYFFSYKWIGPYLAFLYSDHLKSPPPFFFYSKSYLPNHIHTSIFSNVCIHPTGLGAALGSVYFPKKISHAASSIQGLNHQPFDGQATHPPEPQPPQT